MVAARIFKQLSEWKAFEADPSWNAIKRTLPRTLGALRAYVELASGSQRGAAHSMSACASLRQLIRALAKDNKVSSQPMLPSHVIEFLVGVERTLT